MRSQIVMKGMVMVSFFDKLISNTSLESPEKRGGFISNLLGNGSNKKKEKFEEEKEENKNNSDSEDSPLSASDVRFPKITFRSN